MRRQQKRREASQLASSAPASGPGLCWRGCAQGEGNSFVLLPEFSTRLAAKVAFCMWLYYFCYISGNPQPRYFLVYYLLRIRVRRGEASPLGGSRLVCSVKKHGDAHGWSGTGRETLCPQAERGQQRLRPAGHWRAAIKQRGVLDQQVGDLSYTVQNMHQHHLDPAPYQNRSHRLIRPLRKPLKPRTAKSGQVSAWMVFDWHKHSFKSCWGHRKVSKLLAWLAHLAQPAFASTDEKIQG